MKEIQKKIRYLWLHSGDMTSIILSECSIKHTTSGQDTSHTTICASLCVKEFREKRGKRQKCCK